jgi:hypothetical protein
LSWAYCFPRAGVLDIQLVPFLALEIQVREMTKLLGLMDLKSISVQSPGIQKGSGPSMVSLRSMCGHWVRSPPLHVLQASKLILQPLHRLLQPSLLSSNSPSLCPEEKSSMLGVSHALQGLLCGHVCGRKRGGH